MRALTLLLALSACAYDPIAPTIEDAAPDAAVDGAVPDGAPDAAVDAATGAAIDAREIDAPPPPPTVTGTVVPLRIAVTDAVPITLTVSAPPSTTLDWSIQPATAEDSFLPTAGTIAINGAGVGVITVTFVASATPGDRSHLLGLSSLSAGTASYPVETKVRTLTTLGFDQAYADNAGLLVAANTLYGQAVMTTATPVVVMRMGLVSHGSGYAGRMALYTDGGGAPSARVAETAVETITTGAKEYRLAAPVLLAPSATYWLFGNFTASAPVRRHPTSNVTITYLTQPTTTPLPATLPAGSSTGQRRLNYYLLVAQ